jgi:hypothetical protein
MKKIMYACLTIFLMFTLTGSSCREKNAHEGDKIAPAKVNLQHHSAEDDSYHPIYLVDEEDAGIDASSEHNGILIRWEIPHTNEDGTDLDDLEGFFLYKSRLNDSLGIPVFIDEVTDSDSLLAILTPTEDQYLDVNVDLDTRYYYNILAFDDSEGRNFSVPSDTVDYKLISKPLLVYPPADGHFSSDSLPRFEWNRVFGGAGIHYYYFVKVFNDNEDLIWKSDSFFSQDTLAVEYGENGVFRDGYGATLSSGRYIWRVEVASAHEENLGAESQERDFYVD